MSGRTGRLDHPIYHFTSIENLPSILAEGALSCDALVSPRGVLKVEAGDRDIKEWRRQVTVTVDPFGCPADYVPFYYAPRSPIWRDTAEDPDRMRRRMAELLVHHQVPLDVFAGIGTFDDVIADQVRSQLEQSGRVLPVVTKRDWYY